MSVINCLTNLGPNIHPVLQPVLSQAPQCLGAMGARFLSAYAFNPSHITPKAREVRPVTRPLTSRTAAFPSADLQRRTLSFSTTCPNRGILSSVAPRLQRSALRPEDSQRRTFFKFVHEYEKGVSFTFGKLTAVKNPGIRINIPVIQEMWQADMRTDLAKLPHQEVVTRDNVTIKVDGTAQYRVIDAKKAICSIAGVGKKSKGVKWMIMELAQLKMREVLSHYSVDEILQNREKLNQALLEGTQQLSGDWGVEVHSIRIKDIHFDDSMTRAMAKKAEAERTADAKLINANADVQTAEIYSKAAALYEKNPAAMRLRELEAVTRMATEKSNSFFVVPSQVFDTLKELKG
ncbi:MAG: hypothetical protein S4CHLAM102_15610 [Chlamydiia bacterium]|nr:hypothetical protein [Chlamydiia bacterium]